MFANLLSEIRAYGEGILISEQIPTKLASDAIKNTNLKLVHRLVAEDDRRLMASTMNLNEQQTRHLSLLKTGSAVAFFEGLQAPILVRVPIAPAPTGRSSISDTAVRSQMSRSVALRGLHRSVCAQCPENQTGHGCDSTATRVQNDRSASVARRLINVLRFNGDASQAYDEARREFSVFERAPGAVPHCALVTSCESEIEKRGELHNTSHVAVDEVILTISEALHRLEQKRRAASDSNTELAGILADLPRRLATLYDSDGPFAGCSVCQRPCQFRYDMQTGHHIVHSEEFWALFRDPSQPVTVLAECAIGSARTLFGSLPERVRREAAACFAVQQLAEMGLSETRQLQVARRVTSRIYQAGGDDAPRRV
jgi:hypothetical protein